MTSCADLVDGLFTHKQEAARDYREHSRSAKPGLGPFLASLAAQEAEHADALAEIKRRGDLDQLFDASREAPPSLAAEAQGSGDLLARALAHVDASIATLEYLEAHARDRGVAQDLRRLAEEARRARVMVASRRDLETLDGT